ncbi:MAG: flagellar basal body rod protein FlgC [Paracoccaceae bacterium]
MTDLIASMAASASGMAAQSARMRLVGENIANADTPGYHRKLVSFESLAAGTVAAGRVTLDQTQPARHFDPSHPMADAAGYYDGSNVNLVLEIADAREAQRGYEANLRLFDQARQMSSAALTLLRR